MTTDRNGKAGPILSAEASIAAMDKLPDEALQSLLDNFAKISGGVAADARATPETRYEHLRWRALSAEMRSGKPQAAALVREELREWASSENSPFILRPAAAATKPVRSGRGRRLTIVGLGMWSVFVLYRTADSHTVAGIDLYHWDQEDFLPNLLGLPAAASLAYVLGRWALKGGADAGLRGRDLTFKRPKDLNRSERLLHLVLLPLVLVPLGIYVLAGGMSDESLSTMMVGLIVATSPFWTLVRLRDGPPNRKPRPK